MNMKTKTNDELAEFIQEFNKSDEPNLLILGLAVEAKKELEKRAEEIANINKSNELLFSINTDNLLREQFDGVLTLFKKITQE